MRNRADRFQGNCCRNKNRRQPNRCNGKAGFSDNYSHSNRHKFYSQEKSRTPNNYSQFSREVEDRENRDRTFGWRSSRFGRFDFKSKNSRNCSEN